MHTVRYRFNGLVTDCAQGACNSNRRLRNLCGRSSCVRQATQQQTNQQTNQKNNQPTNRMFAIYLIMLGNTHIYFEVYILWNRRTPQPKANPTQEKKVKSSIWVTFSHNKCFFVEWNWFYIGNSLQETQRNQILRKHPNKRKQPTNQPINQPIDQPINSLDNQPTNH